jgi:hypothetical protein
MMPPDHPGRAQVKLWFMPVLTWSFLDDAGRAPVDQGRAPVDPGRTQDDFGRATVIRTQWIENGKNDDVDT